MPDYRRCRVPGGSYFFTVNLLDRRSDLLVRHIDLLRAVVVSVRRKTAISHRRLGGLAGSPALRVDAAGRR